ncbi:hypothetical protein GN956_G7249 [Arapaima gigas]
MNSKQDLSKMALSFCLLLTFTLGAPFESSTSSPYSITDTSDVGPGGSSTFTPPVSTSAAEPVAGSQSTSATFTSLNLFSSSVSASTQEKPSTLGSTATAPLPQSTGPTTGHFPSSPSSTTQTVSSSTHTATPTPGNHISQATGTPSTATGQPVPTNSTAAPPAEKQGNELTLQEKIITGFIGGLLGLVLLMMLLYVLLTSMKNRSQFNHQPLYEDSLETRDRFAPSSDTLVISGGLYDGPQVLRPPGETGSYEEFPSQPPHFRLEFLKEDEQLSAHRNPPASE